MLAFLGWVVFFVVAWLTAILVVPWANWIRFWPVGLVGMIVNYGIDTTLIVLGAFRYSQGKPNLKGIPVFYLLSVFPGGLLLASFFPEVRWMQFPYILLASLVLLSMELFMKWTGYFHHMKWNPVNSFFLNITAFTLVLWLAQWLGVFD